MRTNDQRSALASLIVANWRVQVRLFSSPYIENCPHILRVKCHQANLIACSSVPAFCCERAKARHEVQRARRTRRGVCENLEQHIP